MAADGARPDELALLWKALYALAGICGAGFLFLFAFIQRGKAALWASVNQQGRDAGDTRECRDPKEPESDVLTDVAVIE